MGTIYLSRGGRGSKVKTSEWDKAALQTEFSGLNEDLEFVDGIAKAEYVVIPDGALPPESVHPRAFIKTVSEFRRMLRKATNKHSNRKKKPSSKKSFKKSSNKKNSSKRKSSKKSFRKTPKSLSDHRKKHKPSKPSMRKSFAKVETPARKKKKSNAGLYVDVADEIDSEEAVKAMAKMFEISSDAKKSKASSSSSKVPILPKVVPAKAASPQKSSSVDKQKTSFGKFSIFSAKGGESFGQGGPASSEPTAITPIRQKEKPKPSSPPKSSSIDKKTVSVPKSSSIDKKNASIPKSSSIDKRVVSPLKTVASLGHQKGSSKKASASLDKKGSSKKASASIDKKGSSKKASASLDKKGSAHKSSDELDEKHINGKSPPNKNCAPCEQIIRELRIIYQNVDVIPPLNEVEEMTKTYLDNSHEELASSFAKLVVASLKKAKKPSSKKPHVPKDATVPEVVGEDEEELDEDDEFMKGQKEAEDAIDAMWEDAWQRFRDEKDESDEAYEELLTFLEDEVERMYSLQKVPASTPFLNGLAKEIWDQRDGYIESDVSAGIKDLILHWQEARKKHFHDALRNDELTVHQADFADTAFAVVDKAIADKKTGTSHASLKDIMAYIAKLITAARLKFKHTNTFRYDGFNEDLQFKLVDDLDFEESQVEASIAKLWKKS